MIGQQLSFDDLLADEPAPGPEPRRLLTPAEVAARCGLSYAPSPEQARVVEGELLKDPVLPSARRLAREP